MRVGLQLPSFTWPGGDAEIAPRLVEIAQAAEAAGFASLWVMDHFVPLPGWGARDEPMLECYTTLGFLAAHTRTIRLGPLVAGVVYRHPGVLLKTATTFDVLCGGRSYLGIGAAWYVEEARALGVPWPARAERFERLEETLQLARQMFRDDRTPFTGTHYQLDQPVNRPQPLARPRLPIMIGGNGERITLRLVAEYGDACNFLVIPPAVIRNKLEVLKRHCDAVQRDIASIEITALSEVDLRPGKHTARDVVALLTELDAVGVEHAILNLPDVHDLRRMETFACEILPAVTSV